VGERSVTHLWARRQMMGGASLTHPSVRNKKKARKAFFSEEKKQKTFIFWSHLYRVAKHYAI
jgi:hypothetical protein